MKTRNEETDKTNGRSEAMENDRVRHVLQGTRRVRERNTTTLDGRESRPEFRHLGFHF